MKYKHSWVLMSRKVNEMLMKKMNILGVGEPVEDYILTVHPPHRLKLITNLAVCLLK